MSSNNSTAAVAGSSRGGLSPPMPPPLPPPPPPPPVASTSSASDPKESKEKEKDKDKEKKPSLLNQKMQKSIKLNENHLLFLSERAINDSQMLGWLWKKSTSGEKWKIRFFVLYQNLLFYYENKEKTERPLGMIFLEGSYVERVIYSDVTLLPPTPEKTKEKDNKDKDKFEKVEKDHIDRNFCFQINYGREFVRRFEFCGVDDTETILWVYEIERASFSKQHLEMQKVTAKHLHIIQVVEVERTAKWHFSVNCEDLCSEIKFLKEELVAIKRERRVDKFPNTMFHTCMNLEETSCLCCLYESLQDDEEKLTKLRKVQSFLRGWLCRRKWKHIVEKYIKSPHADRLRKRNNVVFQLVEAEEEYIQQMEVLVTCFLRPFKMAASSKKPPCTHDDVNSIFLNSETVFFLHQIFLKGLTARLENWPTLVLGDLFSMLLPMLNIYQEYVRNHHYSLQVLTECKQHNGFAATLKRLESKPVCNGRSLETFLTYPMHQIPRYIVTLHELLAYTPFEHVERKSLETAQVQLEQLSKQMHDEVSATENLRKNLSIERMIVDGCDILLDVKQIFIRQGTLVQVPPPEKKKEKVSFKNLRASYRHHHRKEKEFARQCFLFSFHLIVTRRGNDGNLHLLENFGKIPMCDSILIEDPSEDNGFERGFNSASSAITEQNNVSYQGRDFKLIIACKTLDIPLVIHFVAPTVNDKAAWISDLAACIDNAQFSEFCKPVLAEKSSINLPQYMRNDPHLFLDEPDIRFSKTLNSCKIPQIRYATADKLMERLTDLRFISIEFLNTFLLTYKVFTDGIVVLVALKNVYYTSVEEEKQRRALDDEEIKEENCLKIYGDYRRRGSFLQFPLRRVSGASSVSGYCSEVNSERDRSYSYDSQGQKIYKSVLVSKYEDEPGVVPGPSTSRAGTSNSLLVVAPDKLRSASKSIFIKVNSVEETTREEIPEEESSDESQEADNNIQQADVDSSSNSSESVTDPGVDPCGNCGQEIPVEKLTVEQRRRHNISEEKKIEKRKSAERRKSEGARQELFAKASNDNKESPRRKSDISGERKKITIAEAPGKLAVEKRIRQPLKDTIKLSVGRKRSSSADAGAVVRIVDEQRKSGKGEQQRSKKNFFRNLSSPRPDKKTSKETSLTGENVEVQPAAAEDRHQSTATANGPVELEVRIENRATEARQSIASIQASTQVILGFFQNFYQRAQKDMELPPLPIPRETSQCSTLLHQPNMKHEPTSQAGIVIGGMKIAKRRSSNSYASTAFAIATSAADNPIQFNYTKCVQSNEKQMEQIICTAATMRVLNVLRHWISKQGKDFQINKELKRQTKEFLNEIICYPHHTSVEHKSAAQLLLLLDRQYEEEKPLVDLVELLRPPYESSRESVITLSALEIAEQLTYIDHQIFKQITPEELMGNAWMKADKETRAPHIVMMTKRFNDVSRLIATEIIKKPDLQTRAETIEKWAAVADIVRCLHNFNGVLQICSAFTNAAVFRLKNTWEVVSKTTKQSIEKHQQIVSSDGRFRALRDALHKSDPPCIPYLGVYLTDLSFIEEGTPNFVEDNLINFSKMRMVAHIIREIRQYQHTTYKIDLLTRVSNYLLDASILMDEEELYSESLKIEPRQARLQSQSSIAGSSTTPW